MKIIYLYASWCNPCKVVLPIVEDVCKKYDIELERIDVDKDSEAAEDFGVKNIPTILFVDDYEALVKRHIGMLTKEQLEKIVNDIIDNQK